MKVSPQLGKSFLQTCKRGVSIPPVPNVQKTMGGVYDQPLYKKGKKAAEEITKEATEKIRKSKTPLDIGKNIDIQG